MKQLEAIKELAEAATEGPWFREYGDVVLAEPDPYDVTAGYDEPEHKRVFHRAMHLDYKDPQGVKDADFAAHARTVVPKMTAALEAVEALHRPIEATYFSADDEYSATVCGTCFSESEEAPESYPCPTLTAITEALA